MSMRVPKTSNNCEYCEKILHGRADQRFCNDTCRNSFNRKVRAAERIVFHPNAGEIIKIIKKNYEILSRGIPGEIEENETRFTGVQELLQSGFNPKFFTSAFTSKQETEWICVFERCVFFDEDTAYIKDFPDQAGIEN